MFVVLTAEEVHDTVIGTSMTLTHARVKGLSPCRTRGGTESSESSNDVVFAPILKEGSLPIEESNKFAIKSAGAQRRKYH